MNYSPSSPCTFSWSCSHRHKIDKALHQFLKEIRNCMLQRSWVGWSIDEDRKRLIFPCPQDHKYISISTVNDKRYIGYPHISAINHIMITLDLKLIRQILPKFPKYVRPIYYIKISTNLYRIYFKLKNMLQRRSSIFRLIFKQVSILN